MEKFSEAEVQAKRILPHKVYLVSCPEDSTVLVAIDVSIKDGYITWFDTVKERVMKIGEITIDNDEIFVFTRGDQEGNPSYELRPLTLELYEETVKPKLNNAQDFSKEEDMFAAFEITKENAW